MKLSSAYLAERLRERYDVLTCENISGEDAYFRPFLQTRDVAPARGRVCIVTGTYLKQRQSTIQIQKAKYNWDDVLGDPDRVRSDRRIPQGTKRTLYYA